jgi:Autographiviridae endonuclease VII
MANSAEYQRERYARDPEFRKRQQAAVKAYRKRNKAKINAKRRLRYATDPDYRERCRKNRRNSILKRLYGITLEDYNRLLAKQKGRCAICKKKPRYRLHVDHDHRTKRVRRLLCRKCNPALGLFEDDLRIVRSAARYLAAELKLQRKKGGRAKPARKGSRAARKR